MPLSVGGVLERAEGGAAPAVVHATLYEAFTETARAVPDRPFLAVTPSSGWTIDGATEVSFAQASETVERLKSLYARAGYGLGHRVALLLLNRPEHFLHLLALNALGTAFVAINPDAAPDEMLYLMEHSEADLAVAVSGRVADLRIVAQRREKPFPVLDAFALPAEPPSPSRAPRAGTPGVADEAALFYTSGTTGRPKGCIATNTYFLNVAGQYAAFGGIIALRPG